MQVPHAPPLYLLHFSIWLFLNCIFYKKSVTVSKVYWVPWAILVNHLTCGGSHGKPQYMAGWSQVQVATWDLWLAFEMGQSCETEPLTYEVCANYGVSVLTELTCSTTSWCQRMGEMVVTQNCCEVKKCLEEIDECKCQVLNKSFKGFRIFSICMANLLLISNSQMFFKCYIPQICFLSLNFFSISTV